MNAFVNAIGRGQGLTRNGAISNTTSGNACLDYFSKCGSYVGRDESAVASDMGSIFGNDKLTALKIVFYNRLITRSCDGFVDSDTLQKGQGQRDEFVKSLKWLENNKPELLYTNLWLIPEVGRWSDLWYDSASTGFHYYVNRDKVFNLISRGLRNEKHRGLLAKFLPQIRSSSKVKNDRHRRLNDFARALCKFLGWDERKYRLFKSNPEHSCHQWQRLASSNKWDAINFNTIPGKALFKLVSNKGRDGKTVIERHNLEDKFVSWIKKNPTAKFTGYPYELYKSACDKRNLVKTLTLNAQFNNLIDLVKKDSNGGLLNRKVLCALDTSDSMSWTSYGDNNVKPIDICVGLGIYFSKLIEGHFAGHVILFSDRSEFLKLDGEFCDRVDTIHRNGFAMGSTNYQSVIDAIVNMRLKNPNIPVSDFPDTLLVVSDMQFNPTGSNATNYEHTQMRKLRAVGLNDMSVIWWNVNGNYNPNDVPSTIGDKGTTLISGFDPSIVNVLLDNEKIDEVTKEVVKLTPDEQMIKALNQTVLNELKV